MQLDWLFLFGPRTGQPRDAGCASPGVAQSFKGLPAGDLVIFLRQEHLECEVPDKTEARSALPNWMRVHGRVSYDLAVLLDYIAKNTRVASVRARLEETRKAV